MTSSKEVMYVLGGDRPYAGVSNAWRALQGDTTCLVLCFEIWLGNIAYKCYPFLHWLVHIWTASGQKTDQTWQRWFGYAPWCLHMLEGARRNKHTMVVWVLGCSVVLDALDSQSRSLTLMLLQGFCEKAVQLQISSGESSLGKMLSSGIFQEKPQLLEICRHFGTLGL